MQVRKVKPEDASFVFNSWLLSFRNSKYAGVVSNNEYFKVYRATIEHLLSRGANILVAHPDGYEDRILGYICYEPKCLHYLYIKDPYLKLGVSDLLVAESLLPEDSFYTFKYRQVEKALPNGKWAPEIARRRDYSGR